MWICSWVDCSCGGGVWVLFVIGLGFGVMVVLWLCGYFNVRVIISSVLI